MNDTDTLRRLIADSDARLCQYWAVIEVLAGSANAAARTASEARVTADRAYAVDLIFTFGALCASEEKLQAQLRERLHPELAGLR